MNWPVLIVAGVFGIVGIFVNRRKFWLDNDIMAFVVFAIGAILVMDFIISPVAPDGCYVDYDGRTSGRLVCD